MAKEKVDIEKLSVRQSSVRPTVRPTDRSEMKGGEGEREREEGGWGVAKRDGFRVRLKNTKSETGVDRLRKQVRDAEASLDRHRNIVFSLFHFHSNPRHPHTPVSQSELLVTL